MFSTKELRKNNGARQPGSSLVAHFAAIILALTMIQLPSTALAGRPPTPANFRVTATTAYTVTLAWDPAPPRSGDFNYYLWGAYNVGPTVILPRTATSYTFTALFPGNTYTFGMYARNAAGQTSSQVNVSGIRLPNDITPPTTAPIVHIDQVGSNYANISWIPAQDDGPHLSTQIYLNGVFYFGVGRGITTAILRSLQPGTTYSLTARAIDFGNNPGPFSNPVTLVTLPVNPNDHTPPSTPTNLSAYSFGDGSTEMQIQWTQSTDDFDAQANIRYDVYVNGALEDFRFGSGGPIIAYGVFGQNMIEVIASDTAGNASSPATTTLFIP
ncbi:MAG TPA: fibronectin type III domain-containing protein [Candidatus Udaeobacter sp.]